jgi:hypothetical protein
MYDMETLVPMKRESTIKKSKSGNKSDFIIKFIKNNTFINCSIKCKHGAMPAILNHTPRSAKVFQCNGKLTLELKKLDEIIKYLNNERSNGKVGEDVHIKKMNIDGKSRTCIINVISYFLFEGTGVGISKCPSNSILEIQDPNDIKKWKYYNCITDNDKKKYVEKIYDNIVISMRDKGMPTKKNDLCNPWIFFQKKENGAIKEKGSLHIRLKK